MQTTAWTPPSSAKTANTVTIADRLLVYPAGQPVAELSIMSAVYFCVKLYREQHNFEVTNLQGVELASLRNGMLKADEHFGGMLYQFDQYNAKERNYAVTQALADLKANVAAIRQAEDAQATAAPFEAAEAQDTDNAASANESSRNRNNNRNNNRNLQRDRRS